MISNESRAVAEEAKKLYESSLKDVLERDGFGKYVSIEPLSGDYFVGDTFDDAVNAAIDKYPTRLTHTIRVGHRAAFHLGVLEQ